MHTEHVPNALLGSDTVKKIIAGIDQLPAPPPVATKILKLVLEGKAGFSTISEMVSTEPTLALKILRMANSMTYGYRGKVETVDKAVATIGFESLKSLMLSTVVRESLISESRSKDPLLTHVWKHSVACAVGADLVAAKVAPDLVSQAFSAGLIHDCGQLVMLSCFPDLYEPVLRDSMAGKDTIVVLEDGALGVDHMQVGKWLLNGWKVPADLVDTAWLHHQPPEVLRGMGEGGRLPAVIALADMLSHELMHDAPPAGGTGDRAELADMFSLDEAALESIKKDIGKGFIQRAEMFELDSDPGNFYFEVLSRANNKLASVNADMYARDRKISFANKVLAIINRAGRQLVEAKAPDDVFNAVREALVSGFGATRGVAYRVDAGEGRILGVRFDRQDAVSFEVPLDADMRPVEFEDGVPEDMRTLLKGYLARIPDSDGMDLEQPAPLTVPPWRVMSFMAEDGFLGELALELPKGPYGSKAASDALGQLAALGAGALHRLDMHARLEERAERLASALRKIRRMNHKLLQTERLAAVGQLAAGAAHEINNPLAIIYARAQLLELSEKDDKRKSDFGQMISQIERITTILNSLMDFARPAPPSMAPTSLNAVVERTVALVQGGLGRQGIAVDIDLNPELPLVEGDGSQLEQVVLNLLINAEHAVAEKHGTSGGRICIATHARGANAALSITDNGVGIESDNLNKVFDPFFTTKEEGKGTGLGLSTSYGIIQGHNGDIRFHSPKDGGTEVTVLLPLTSQMSKVSSQNTVRSTAQTILVVDDEKHIRDILRESLETRGYAVETASDGEKGLELLSRGLYRLLLVDVRMPSRDGLSLLSRIQKRISDMPVIVLTGMAGPDEIDKALQMGVYKCIRKPFQIDPLMEDIAAALEERDNAHSTIDP